ncbi:MAG: hydrogenase expression/formation protein HypE [candidate division Zixibacteria bacterium]|nr:hydrogenase expression/formation protein HypE [candidate division Zixibacteria bacterium]
MQTETNDPILSSFMSDHPVVTLAHGGGGKMMHRLIRDLFRTIFSNGDRMVEHDSAVLDVVDSRLAFTTDSYVVKPLFFPGGDIGSLAVYGTVNDLAMSGAEPLYISAGFIIEEGFPSDMLIKIAQSMQAACENARVRVVTGDTKVVEKGKGDGLFINTSGVGAIRHRYKIHPGSVKAGDAIIINGDIGRHGLAALLSRNEFSLKSDIRSDSAPVSHAIMRLLNAGIPIHCLRDLTRGGLASALVEIAGASGFHFEIEESQVPVESEVTAICEVLGFDPIHIANEGKFIAFIPESDTQDALNILRKECSMPESQAIGKALDSDQAIVTMRNEFGTSRIIDMSAGEQLPRIC